MANKVEIVVKQKKVTKNMVLYTPVNGKGKEMVDPYFDQKLLMKAFEKFPRGLRITLEEVEVVEVVDSKGKSWAATISELEVEDR